MLSSRDLSRIFSCSHIILRIPAQTFWKFRDLPKQSVSLIRMFFVRGAIPWVVISANTDILYIHSFVKTPEMLKNRFLVCLFLSSFFLIAQPVLCIDSGVFRFSHKQVYLYFVS